MKADGEAMLHPRSAGFAFFSILIADMLCYRKRADYEENVQQ
jgi:hypothetical protein